MTSNLWFLIAIGIFIVIIIIVICISFSVLMKDENEITIMVEDKQKKIGEVKRLTHSHTTSQSIPQQLDNFKQYKFKNTKYKLEENPINKYNIKIKDF